MRRPLASFVTLLLAGALIGPAATPANAVVAAKPDTTAGTNGTVYAVLQVGGRIYLGGKFTWAGPLTGNGAAVNGTDGTRLNTAARPNGVVRAAVAGPTGSWYVGGDFTKIGKSNRLGAARISSSGSLSSGWNPRVNGSVRAIAVSGDVVYLAGSFSSVGGTARANLAAVDASGALLPWNPGASGPVESLAVSPDGTTVYVGGTFGQAGGASRANLAAIDASTGSATSWNPGASGTVEALAADAATVYAGGSFGQAGGASRANLAAIDASTGSATSWDPGAGAAVHAVALAGETLYAGGAFETLGGAARSRIGAVSTSTGSPTAFDPGANGEVRSLSLAGDGRIYVGGAFTTLGGEARVRAGAVSLATGVADGWNQRADATVHAVAASGTKAYVGGEFRMLNGAPRNNVAALDAATGEVDLGFNANANAKLRALAASPDGHTIYLGGSFFKVGGLPRDKVAAVDAATGAPTPWKPNANREVRAIIASGTSVWVGGAFTQIAGSQEPFLAGVSAATGDLLPGFDANADAMVRALDVSPDGTKLYAGGDFRQMGGASRNGIAELNPATGAATSFAPTEGGVVLDVELSPDGQYLYACTTSNRTHRFQPAASNAPLWSMHTGGDVQAIASTAETVYVGGHFTKFTTQNVERRRIGAVRAADMSVVDWNPKTNSFYGPWAMQAVDGGLLVGGDFTSTGGQQQPYFARFSGTP
jgi:hypothetical protein